MRRRHLVPTLAGLAAFAVCGPAAAQVVRPPVPPPPAGDTKWVVDPVHSQVDFRVRHLVGRVRGTFTDWYGILFTRDRNWTHGTVKVSVQTTSLDTGNKYRDADLRSERFFAVDSFPQMWFQSTGIRVRGDSIEIPGTLTIKGRARPVVLKGQYRGIAQDRDGHERIAFDAGTTIDRRVFGISWNEVVAGLDAIGNDVEITIAIEAVRIGADPPNARGTD